MKHWIKIQQELVNLEEYRRIYEPVFIQGPPGYWQIQAQEKHPSTGIIYWTFNSEAECKSIYREIQSILLKELKLY